MLGNIYMATVTTRRKGNNKYHYLTHKSSTRQYERYLGKRIPDNIEELKREFEEDVFLKEKTSLLEEIRERYSRYIDKSDPKIIDSENRDFKVIHIYSTQRIEGSTMTHGQTKKLLEYKMSPKDTATEHIIEAEQLEEIFDELLANPNISKELILNWHNTLFEKTDINNAGSFRRQDVGPLGGSSEYSLWPDVIPDIRDLLRWYKKNKNSLNPVILAALFHKKFETIHPFIDGNGRVGRLLMLLVLYKNKYPWINILPREKLTYLKKLEASQAQDNDMIFLKWFVSKYIRDNKRYL